MALVLAIAVAFLVATSSLLQHGATQTVHAGGAGGFGFFRQLLGSRRWLAAKSLDVLALGLEIVALSKGSLVLFQTVITSSVVIATVAESRRSRRRLHKREVAGGMAIVLGAGFVGLAHPEGPDVEVSLRGWLLATLVIAALIVVGLSVARGRPTIEASMLAIATGTLFSFDAAFLKNATTLWSAHGFTILVLASVLGYLVAAVIGNVLIHRAYRRAPLRFSLPALTAAQPVSAIVIALLVLQEHFPSGSIARVSTFGGITFVVLGSFVASGAASDTPDVAAPVDEHNASAVLTDLR